MKTPEHKKMSNSRLGLDFGKVIMGAVKDGRADTSFLGTTFTEAMKSRPEDGAIDSINQLVSEFAGHVWIVSKCGPSVENKTRGWLKHRSFYEATGFDRANLRFCRERSDKAKICRQLRISHFVDDRLDVLEPMVGIVPNLFLFGEQTSGANLPEWATPAPNWSGLMDEIRRSLAHQC